MAVFAAVSALFPALPFFDGEGHGRRMNRGHEENGSACDGVLPSVRMDLLVPGASRLHGAALVLGALRRAGAGLKLDAVFA